MQTQLTVPAHVAEVFARESSDPRVMVAHGYGIKITVDNSHLTVRDGIGPCRRERRVPMIDRTLRRLIVTGPDGYLTLSALRWCRKRGIAVIALDPAGQLVTASAGHEPPRGPTIRAQALCMAGGPYEQAGVDIARLVIQHKLRGQAVVAADYLDDQRIYREINRLTGMLSDATSISEISRIEATAAYAYFTAWRNLKLLWNKESTKKIPDHWHQYTSRRSAISSNNREASDPANAMLNYAYKMVEIEAKLACLATGLHPSLGFLHLDKQDGESLTYDLMEVARSEADKFVLGMLASPVNDYPRTFDRREFQDSDGNVRLKAPLSHEIAEKALTWSAPMYPIAEQITDIISRAARGKYSASQVNRSKRSQTSDRSQPSPQSDPAPRRTRRIPACVTSSPWLEVIPPSLWDSLSSLASSLPAYGSRKEQVSRHQVIAALAYIRANEIPQSQIPPGFLVSRGSVTRRWQLWKLTDEWEKIESVILDYHRS